MSPLKIRILLHYFAHPVDEYPMPNSHAIDELFGDGLLTDRVADASDHRRYNAYTTTPKGDAYVEAICSIPLPVQLWVIPKE